MKEYYNLAFSMVLTILMLINTAQVKYNKDEITKIQDSVFMDRYTATKAMKDKAELIKHIDDKCNEIYTK